MSVAPFGICKDAISDFYEHFSAGFLFLYSQHNWLPISRPMTSCQSNSPTRSLCLGIRNVCQYPDFLIFCTIGL